MLGQTGISADTVLTSGITVAVALLTIVIVPLVKSQVTSSQLLARYQQKSDDLGNRVNRLEAIIDEILRAD